MIISESMGPISFAYDGKLSADAEAVVRALVSSTFLSLGKRVRKETRWSTLSAFNFLMTHGWDAVLRKAESQLREVTRVKARCLAVNVVLGHVLRTRPPLPESAVEHDALASWRSPATPCSEPLSSSDYYSRPRHSIMPRFAMTYTARNCG
jgi:hypothetical protein